MNTINIYSQRPSVLGQGAGIAGDKGRALVHEKGTGKETRQQRNHTTFQYN